LSRYGASLRLRSQTRRGVSAARNFGARVARGRFLAFLDSDDLWQPKKLQVQTGYMLRHPTVEICQTEEIWTRHGVRVNPRAVHRKPSGDIFLRSLELCLVSPSAVMVTRALFHEAGGFDEALPVCEDYDLWLRLGVDHLFGLVPEPLVIKRGGRDDQLSHSVWGMDRYRIIALQKLLRSPISGARRAAALAAMRRKIAILAQGARKRDRERDARDYEALLEEFDAEKSNDRYGDLRLRQGEGVSSPHA
jgi:glycosyltransferase involved in cell wall biosynthesis